MAKRRAPMGEETPRLRRRTAPFRVRDGRVAEARLRAGADPNARDVYGMTPLHLCAGHEAVTRILLAHGADPHARDPWGRTPLYEAGAAGVVRALVEHGADPNARDADMNPPLMCVAVPDVMRALLEHGADPNIRNGRGDKYADCMARFLLQDDPVVYECARLVVRYGGTPSGAVLPPKFKALFARAGFTPGEALPLQQQCMRVIIRDHVDLEGAPPRIVADIMEYPPG